MNGAIRWTPRAEKDLRQIDLRVRFGFDEKHGTMVILRVLKRDKAYGR